MPNDSTNIKQALNSLKFSYPYSTSRKPDRETLANNPPSKTAINNLPNNNLPIHFEGSSKVLDVQHFFRRFIPKFEASFLKSDYLVMIQSTVCRWPLLFSIFLEIVRYRS